MHCLAVKFRSVLPGVLAACRKATVVALAIVEMMIDVSIEMITAVIPRSRPYERAARVPLRTIVTIGGAVVRGTFVIPVRASRRYSDVDRNLRWRVVGCCQKQTCGNRRKS
jgi:hypothetical protein